MTKSGGRSFWLWSVALTLTAIAALTAFAANNENNNPTNNELYIEEVFVTPGDPNVDCPNGPIEIDTVTIEGVNFDNGDRPIVIFGRQGPLTICSADGTTIVAELPNPVFDGDYRVFVSTGPAVKNFSEYDLTVRAVGSEGPRGPTGAKGDQGDVGPFVDR